MADSTLVPASRGASALRLCAGFVAGVALALGQAPYDLWPVAMAGLLLAVWLFSTAQRPGLAWLLGWAVGLGHFGLALIWITEPFMVDAAQTGWMAPFALVGLAGGLALFWAFAFWGAAQADRLRLPALVAIWTMVELIRAYAFTGFPWAMISYVWLETPVIQWVSVIGPHGLTCATLGAVALLVCAPRSTAARLAGAAAAITLFAGGWALTPPPQDLTDRPMVRMVQPNAPQDQKWHPEMIPVFFDRQIAQTGADPAPGSQRPALVVWPETALPMMLNKAQDALTLASEAAQGAQVVVGVQRAWEGRYFNSLAVVDGAGALSAVYDKHHLVPFGEYMPFANLFIRWNIFGLAARAEGAYSPGPGPRLIDLGPLGKAVPLICYEAVFPQDIFGAPAGADMLLHITNDAWFGTQSGPHQHLAQSRIRAIENGLPLLRAANTGISAVVDGAGRVLAFRGLGETGHVDAPLPPPLRRTLYSRTGDLAVMGGLVLLGLALIFTLRRVRD